MFLDVLDTTRLELCLVIFDRRQISLIFTAHYSKKWATRITLIFMNKKFT